MPENKKQYYFDAVTLCNFALAHCVDLLIKRYGSNIFVTSEVRDEIANGIAVGYHDLLDIELAVSRKHFSEAAMTTSERELYIDFLHYMGAGESSCIACAKLRGGVVVSDDKTARDCCAKHGIAFTGTIGVLKSSCPDACITVQAADDILHEMIRQGFYSPVRSISDIM